MTRKGAKLPTDPGPAEIMEALGVAHGEKVAPVHSVRVAITTQNQIIRNVLNLQKQFARDSASWQHCEDMMHDLQRVVELISQ